MDGAPTRRHRPYGPTTCRRTRASPYSQNRGVSLGEKQRVPPWVPAACPARTRLYPIRINALDLSTTKISIFNDAAYTLANSARSGYLIFLRDDSLRANLLCFKGYKQGRVCGGGLQAETLTAMDGLNKGEHVKGVGISMGCVPYGAVNEDYTDSKNLVMQVESTSQSFQDQRALHLINQLRQRVSEEKLKLYSQKLTMVPLIHLLFLEDSL